MSLLMQEVLTSPEDMVSLRNVVGSNPAHGEVYSIHHHVIKFVSDLRQVSGFLRERQLPPAIKLTTTI